MNSKKDDELDDSYLNSTAPDEDAILSSPKGSTSSKSPETQISTLTTSAPTQAKKIVLKRKLLPSVSLTESDSLKTTTEPKVSKLNDEKSEDESADVSSNGNNDNTVVKLSELTMKERMELRAKKFGAAPTGDVAKLARAERFGITTITAAASGTTAAAKTDSKDSSLSITKTAPNVDLLKKRAERFGGSVSNAMVSIEQKEKLLKRQERFGAGASSSTVSGTVKTSTTTTTDPISTQATSDYAEKAKLRLERFKTTA